VLQFSFHQLKESQLKIKVTAHIHYSKWIWDDKGEFEIWSMRMDDDDYRVYVCSQEIEIEVPDNYDPRAPQIAALEKKKQKVMAEYQKTVTEINDQINKLQALEYTHAAQ
jgi:hypothetical protein